MSERVGSASRAAVAFFLFGLGTLFPAGAAAQEALLSPAERADLDAELARIEARLAELDVLERRLLEASIARPGDAGSEHVRADVGPFEIWGMPDMLPAAVEGATKALHDFEALVEDGAGLPPLRIEVFDRERLARRTAVGFDRARTAGEGVVVITATPEDISWLVNRHVREHVLGSIPAPLVAWSSGWGWDAAYRAADGLRVLVGSTDPDGVRCLQEGDLDACGRFLALSYDGTVESRLALLEYHYPVGVTAPSVAGDAPSDNLVHRCVAEERRRGTADPRSACLAEIASRESSSLGVLPTHPAARGSIVAHALRVGGGNALSRLMALPEGASAGEQLAAIAGTTVGELVRSWREDVSLGAGLFRSDAGDRPGPVSLFWAGGLALLALRSTRWRLG